MKHFIFFFQLVSFLTGFLSIASGLLIYERYKDSRLKYYILFLASLTLILFEQLITAYEVVNFINRIAMGMILQVISALGCILMVYALPLLVCSLFEITVTRSKKILIYLLTAIPALALLMYYFSPFESLAMVAANTLLFLTVLISLIYSAVRLKNIKNNEIRRLYGNLLIITFIAFPFMYVDSRFGDMAIIQRHFPYGLLSVPIYYFAWNVVFLVFAYKYYKRYIGMEAKNAEPEMSEGSTENDFYERYKITNREKDVIVLLVEGKSYSEISEALSISMPTVKTHIYNIYQKTGVNNKVELINLIK